MSFLYVNNAEVLATLKESYELLNSLELTAAAKKMRLTGYTSTVKKIGKVIAKAEKDLQEK